MPPPPPPQITKSANGNHTFPQHPASSLKMSTGLPPEWEVRVSKTRQMPYYFNRDTNESRWEPPTETNISQLQSYLTANFAPQSAQAEKIRVRHLLVKHNQSRRPSSWKEEKITRSPEEARKILEGHQARIQSGSISLGELAGSESDCSSYRKQGDLGYFGKGEMQPEFEQAAYNLKVGEISPIVSTQSGLHLIERIA